MAIATLIDGRRVRVPDNLSDVELENYIASNFPVLAAETGRYADFEREFDFSSEIKDAGLRYDLAAASTPEEYANVLNQKVGEGNWGFTEYGKAYITSKGRQIAGYEPTDDRKVLVDSGLAPFSYHDLVDIAPEGIKVAASTAAVALIPITGGTSTTILGSLLGRGIAARGFQAAVGDAAANLGIEAVQASKDQQLESAGDLLSRVGLEGAIVFGASVVPDYLFRGAKGAIGRIKDARASIDETVEPIPQITATDFINARDAAKQVVPEADVPYLTLHTLMSESGSPLGSIISKIEATGRKFGAGVNVQEAREFISKMQTVRSQINKGALSPDPQSIMNYYKSIMTKANDQTAKKVYDLFMNYNKTPFGKIDVAAKNVHQFKKNAAKAVYNNYKAFQRTMSGPSYYGSDILKSASYKGISNQQLGNIVKDIQRQTGFETSLILQKLSIPEANLAERIQSRILVNPDGSFKIAKKGQREDLTVGSLRQIDSNLKQAAFAGKELRPSQTFENLNVSLALNKSLEKLPGLGKQFTDELKRVNSEYARGAQVFRGGPEDKISLLKMFDIAARDPEQLINKFINGQSGADIDNVLNSFKRAFDRKTVGATDPKFLTMSTADELVSQLTHSYLRDLRLEVGQAFKEGGLEAGQAAAKRVLTRINNIETNLAKQGAVKTGLAVRQAVGRDYVKGFKNVLREASEGQTAKSIDAQNILTQAFNYGNYKQLITEISSTVNRLGDINLLDNALQKINLMKKADPQGAKFYQDLHYTESVSELMEAFAKATPEEQLTAINKVTQNWVNGLQANGKDKLKQLFGENYDNLNTIMLVTRGATQFGESGTLFTAQLPFSLLNGVLKRDVKGIIRPLSMMYALKGMGPGTSLWKKTSADMEGMIRNGKSAQEAIGLTKKKNSKAIQDALRKAKRLSEAVMSGRSGFIGAVIGNYMEEDHDNLPQYDDLPNAPVVEAPMSQPEPQPQQVSQVSPQMGINAIRQIASMIEGTGTGGIEEGASIARSVA
jgi:hypothetical protein